MKPTTLLAEQLKKMNEALLIFDLAVEEHELTKSISLFDNDGNHLGVLQEGFVKIMAELDRDAAVVIWSQVVNLRMDSFRKGARTGKAEALAGFHELLGIDKLCKAIRGVDE